MWLRPKEMTEVYIPLAFHVEKGVTKITIEISTQLLQKQEILEIEILPEGSLVHKHTSVLLDLKNRAHVLQFMKIPVDEKEIIPYEIFRYKSISRNSIFFFKYLFISFFIEKDVMCLVQQMPK